MRYWLPPPLRFDAAGVFSGAEVAGLVGTGGRPIFDARSRDRFQGRAPEPRPGLQSGHMPGASCVPFTELTGADGLFLDAESLREIFGDVAGRPVLSCGSGMTACVLALGLARIGAPSTLYDGSWSEWGQGQLGPIVTE